MYWYWINRERWWRTGGERDEGNWWGLSFSCWEIYSRWWLDQYVNGLKRWIKRLEEISNIIMQPERQQQKDEITIRNYYLGGSGFPLSAKIQWVLRCRSLFGNALFVIRNNDKTLLSIVNVGLLLLIVHWLCFFWANILLGFLSICKEEKAEL